MEILVVKRKLIVRKNYLRHTKKGSVYVSGCSCYREYFETIKKKKIL